MTLDSKLSKADKSLLSSQQVSLLGNSPEGCPGVALLQSEAGDAGLMAFGLAKHMLESGRCAIKFSCGQYLQKGSCIMDCC